MIRPSLDPYTYLEHAKSTFLVASECLSKFLEIMDQPIHIEENRLKQMGFFRSTLLHYAITLELLLKALALHEERLNIEFGEIITFNDFLKKLKKGKGKRNGHDFKTIIEKYHLNFTPEELKLIYELQEYAIWAGRFPYPIDDDEIKELENKIGESGPPLSLDIEENMKRILEHVKNNLLEI